MIRRGHIMMKLAPQVETRLPAHLDVLDGAARMGGTIDGRGAVDRTILSRTTALRAKRCFHAHDSLSQLGCRHVHFNTTERKLGLDQVLTLQIDDPSQTETVVESLRDLQEVEWAMPEPLASVPFRMPGVAAQSVGVNVAADCVGADQAHEIEPGSRSISVAVIDTGIALEHVEFSGRLRSGYDTVNLGIGQVTDEVVLVGDSLGRDFCARDETGHGTHVAGIVGARGLAMQRGVAGHSPIIPIRALAAAKAGSGPVFGVGALSDLDSAIKVAVDMGAKVLNMSFGTPRSEMDFGAPPPHQDSIAYAVAQGCIPVAAMGNSGLEEEYFPAALPDCIAVGACTLDGTRAEFSTIGRHIALTAPGEDIWSASMSGYADSSGTSHAAPFVSGAAALLVSRAKRRGHDLTLSEAREALCLSASGDEPNPETGWGMLNIPVALQYLDTMMDQNKEASR